MPSWMPGPRESYFRPCSGMVLEQSVEESVNVNPESESAGRQICAACGSANRKGNSFCANCGVRSVEDAGRGGCDTANSRSAPEAPGDHHYHHHYHHHYFSSAGGMEPLGRCPRRGQPAAQVPAATWPECEPPAQWSIRVKPGRDRTPQSDPGLGAGLQHQTAGRPGGPLPSRRHRAAAQCSGGAGNGGHPRIFLRVARCRYE